MVEGAAFETQCTARYRGFESLILRAMQSMKGAARKCGVFAFMGVDVESLLS